MRKNPLLGHAQFLFWGSVAGLEVRDDCGPAISTTTVYIPTTVYAPASNVTTSSISITTSIPVGNTSSISLTSSIPFGNASTSLALPPTTIPPTASSSAGPPPKPSDPFGETPPPPPGPFRGFKNAVGVNSGYHPQELPVSELTHILYAFADIDLNGTVKSSDPAIDLDKRYPRDSISNRTSNVYGAIKQLYIHKKKNRNLKTLLSIGGWNYSPKFAAVAASEATRHTFATTAVKLITDWGFDGIDIDWEFPASDIERDNFVKLLEACRNALDRHSLLNDVKYRFTISVASSATPANYAYMDLAAMNKYVDTWHLMAYDYSGSWDTVSGHQANVFAYTSNNATTQKPSTDDAVKYYESNGIHPQKIIMGLPLYGRAFEGTSGIGQNYSGIGEGGPQAGVWYYKDLPKPGAVEIYDDVAKATYSYDASTKELISYDNVRSTTYKSQYLKWRNLGGAFFWEARGDKAGGQGLVNTMSKSLTWLDDTPNNLHYPTSKYHNVRLGMPGE
ncbi:hypothetical protein Hte_000940 [Hypoxylon texense]